jgi:hypothetical protein
MTDNSSFKRTMKKSLYLFALPFLMLFVLPIWFGILWFLFGVLTTPAFGV